MPVILHEIVHEACLTIEAGKEILVHSHCRLDASLVDQSKA